MTLSREYAGIPIAIGMSLLCSYFLAKAGGTAVGRIYHLRVWLEFHAMALAEQILPADIRSVNRMTHRLGTRAAHEALNELVIERAQHETGTKGMPPRPLFRG